jgi:hypothetical protein
MVVEDDEVAALLEKFASEVDVSTWWRREAGAPEAFTTPFVLAWLPAAAVVVVELFEAA